MRLKILIAVLLVFSLVANLPPELKIAGYTFKRPSINIQLNNRGYVRDLDFKLGLDLQGGTHLVYETDLKDIPESERASAVNATKDNIERRINSLGVSEPLILVSKAASGEYRLIVELPGVKDVNQAMQTIGQTAQLDFRLPKVATPSSITDFAATGLTGKDLKSAQVQFGSGNVSQAGPSVGIQFNAEGARKFSEITRNHIGEQLFIFLDDLPVSNPVIQQEITGDQAVISGTFTVDEAKQLAIQLNAGALPVPIKVVEQRTVGATLGNESILRSLLAGLVGFFLILIFMVANYGLKGIFANIALILYVLISLTIFKLIPITLTLAGIAGFVLSVGMAVDANILIFERIKEEIRWGRPIRAAVELGFMRAWTSVRDSNASSLITASILFWFGTGTIRGFALTLIVGILVSLFTSITITRGLIRTLYLRK